MFGLWRLARPGGKRRGDAQSGQVAILAAAFAPIAVLMAAMAIDLGSVAGQKRNLQGLADMAAIAAASNLDQAEVAALDVLIDNGYFGAATPSLQAAGTIEEMMTRVSGAVQVDRGRYIPDQKADFDMRFEVGGLPTNAVRVSLTEAPQRYFGVKRPGQGPVSAAGTASVSSQAAITIGSRLVSLEDGIINLLLEEMTGSSVSLTAMDYRGLAGAEIDLLHTFETLESDLDLNAVTYEDVLDADVTMSDLLSAMADSPGNSLAVQSSLNGLADEPEFARLDVPLNLLFDLGRAARLGLGGAESDDLDLSVSALQMLTTSTAAATGSHQVELDLGSDIVGIASLEISLRIGERPQSSPWFSVNENGKAMVSTAQLRLHIKAGVSGLGLLGDELLHLPLYIELAPATARVADIICESGQRDPTRVDLNVRPGLVSVRIAELRNGFSRDAAHQRFGRAKLLNTRLINISALSAVALESANERTVRFYPADFGWKDPKTVETRDALQRALASALDDLNLDIDIGRFSLLSTSLVEGLVTDQVVALAGPLDTTLNSLTAAFGIGLGEADVWVHSARCNRSALVQ